MGVKEFGLGHLKTITNAGWLQSTLAASPVNTPEQKVASSCYISAHKYQNDGDVNNWRHWRQVLRKRPSADGRSLWVKSVGEGRLAVKPSTSLLPGQSTVLTPLSKQHPCTITVERHGTPERVLTVLPPELDREAASLDHAARIFELLYVFLQHQCEKATVEQMKELLQLPIFLCCTPRPPYTYTVEAVHSQLSLCRTPVYMAPDASSSDAACLAAGAPKLRFLQRHSSEVEQQADAFLSSVGIAPLTSVSLVTHLVGELSYPGLRSVSSASSLLLLLKDTIMLANTADIQHTFPKLHELREALRVPSPGSPFELAAANVLVLPVALGIFSSGTSWQEWHENCLGTFGLYDLLEWEAFLSYIGMRRYSLLGADCGAVDACQLYVLAGQIQQPMVAKYVTEMLKMFSSAFSHLRVRVRGAPGGGQFVDMDGHVQLRSMLAGPIYKSFVTDSRQPQTDIEHLVLDLPDNFDRSVVEEMFGLEVDISAATLTWLWCCIIDEVDRSPDPHQGTSWSNRVQRIFDQLCAIGGVAECAERIKDHVAASNHPERVLSYLPPQEDLQAVWDALACRECIRPQSFAPGAVPCLCQPTGVLRLVSSSQAKLFATVTWQGSELVPKLVLQRDVIAFIDGERVTGNLGQSELNLLGVKALQLATLVKAIPLFTLPCEAQFADYFAALEEALYPLVEQTTNAELLFDCLRALAR